MKRFTLAFATVALVATLVGSVQADDGYGVGVRTHAVNHANLARQAQYRNVIQHNIHHNSQARYQRATLRTNLHHQAGHAEVQHHALYNHAIYGGVYRGYSGGFYGGHSGGLYGNHGISVRTPVGSLWLHH